jgi:hypothetical protein
MLSDMVAGAASNAGDIIKLRKAYNDYVEGGGTLSFEEFAKQFGTNADPYKTSS